MDQELPRILSPNLGCPIIISPEDLESKGFSIIMAEDGNELDRELVLTAKPSYPGEGKAFVLEFSDREKLTEGTLPAAFGDVDETRFLISTTLASSIFAGKARFFRYWAKPSTPINKDMIRSIQHQHRPTLYDLLLEKKQKCVSTVFHALCLRTTGKDLNFIHLTDLHISLRNDLYADNVHYSTSDFYNFNQNLRKFIHHANELADEGKVDFVLILGDLIDFLHHGFNERKDYGNNNIEVFRNLILGKANEGHPPIPNTGFKIPVFTTTGNHDWRFFPYNATLQSSVFGVDKKTAEQFDLYWADEQEEISQTVETVYAKLLREGSPISNRTGMGKLINKVLLRLQKWQAQLMTPLTASALIGTLPKLPFGGHLYKFLGSYNRPLWSAMALFVVSVVMGILTGIIRKFIRKRVIDLLAIEAGWQALKDYFLTINPYFNYAFRVENNYFLIMDTGHDCLRAQYLWDDGDKKLGPLSIYDNTIGHSPDVMAFYDVNEYYPYNQINWIDRLMQLITKEAKEANPSARIFIGVHAPPANLSKKDREKADRSAGGPAGLLLAEGEYNIRFGTINHFLSQFFHLCLGRIEEDPVYQRYRPVDMVLAGHAHWQLDLRLEWDHELLRPLVYYGDFTDDRNRFAKNFEDLRPFLLQTPASGPRSESSPEPPYFRRVEIDGQGKIVAAGVMRI
jgi:hypothetical protein